MLESNNYDKIPLEVYQEIYSEAKVKFEETKSRSEMITGRAMQVVLVISGMAAWAANTIYTSGNSYVINISYALILVYCFIKAVNLFFNRSVPLRGTMPRAIYATRDDIINPEFKADLVFYFQQINRYQKKIDKVEYENVQRGRTLSKCFIAAFILFLYTIVLFFCKKNGLL